MPTEQLRRKQFLFVDDDPTFLAGIAQLFGEMSKGAWEIFTAQNHSQALALLRQRSMDVVVLDLDMPVMDGLQFLRLLAKTHPGQQVVILTGRATEESRKLCLESGAALFLEKLITPEGFSAVFDALEVLANAAPQEGFRGMMRRVGLPEVLQMECLGRKSSVLDVFTGKVRGRIFVSEGQIVHAESGSLQGEMALYGLLGLRGGEFNLRPFSEPARRTISGQYEFLLMEAARLNDEGANLLDASPGVAAPAEAAPVQEPTGIVRAEPAPGIGSPVRIVETVLTTGSGEVLYEWQSAPAERRLVLLQQLEEQASLVSRLLPVGRFDRSEFVTDRERIVCQLQPDMRLFVRCSRETGVAW